MAKLLLGDDLQHPKFDENTASQILALLCSPIETDAKYYPVTTYNQHTARTSDKGPCLIGNHKITCTSQTMPPLPPARGLTLPTKRLIPAQSTEQLTEALKEVMIELDTPNPTIRKYKKYLQKQTIEPSDMVQTKM